MRKKMLVGIILPVILIMIGFSSFAQKMGKAIDLRILYVGGSANWEKEYYADNDARNKDIVVRMASFEKMLKQFYTTVTVVIAKDYKQDLSSNFDVTIFDGVPPQIAPSEIVKDSAGRTISYKSAMIISEDFDRPALFIGETGETIGRRIGIKTDWYCLCLDAWALNFRKEHPIFNGPFPVKMTIETRPTPEDAFHYEYFLGHKTPENLPMWRVQTKGYVSDKNFRIGMVARPWGFEDSPDAEYISSGVCQKTLDAVAIGRHGNFLLWGFAASPEFMTVEAQAVLANAISYISKFNGKGIIARKYNDRRATREYLKELKYFATEEAYESNLKLNQQFDKRMLDEKKTAEEKTKNGEKLTAIQKNSLNYVSQPVQTKEEFLKRQMRDFYQLFGNDKMAYVRYLDDNKDFFYSEDASYKIKVDEDVKSLGIPNYDKRLLDKCIGMLEKGEDIGKAGRILDRYTLCSFETPAEWRSWFKKYKDKIFFTETGGYYFMVNSGDKNVEGNDYKKKALKKPLSK